MNIAHTIISQIRSIDKFALSAWGAKEFVSLPNGLQFKTSGSVRKHKGYVKISLNGADLYDIEAFTIRVGEIKVKRQITDIFVEDLVSWLDQIIG
jgi:hypothetical protein